MRALITINTIAMTDGSFICNVFEMNLNIYIDVLRLGGYSRLNIRDIGVRTTLVR